MGNFSISRMKTLDEEQKSKVLELYTKKMVKELEEKRGLTFPVEIYILRKKSKSQM